ncbi:MAG: DUF3240 family protein [Gammaproteobacteria bacterium]|nr:DUF3240 family protein [Gammaproteobacteria bacterium]
MTDLIQIVVVTDHEYKDALVDSLINFTHASGFTLFDVSGFSQEHHHYDIEEQVQGYRNMVRLEVTIATQYKSELLELLTNIPKRSTFRYWELPVLGTGHID